MTLALGFLFVSASILASATGHGDLGLLLAVCAVIALVGAFLGDLEEDRRDARRRNGR